MPTASVIV